MHPTYVGFHESTRRTTGVRIDPDPVGSWLGSDNPLSNLRQSTSRPNLNSVGGMTRRVGESYSRSKNSLVTLEQDLFLCPHVYVSRFPLISLRKETHWYLHPGVRFLRQDLVGCHFLRDREGRPFRLSGVARVPGNYLLGWGKKF